MGGVDETNVLIPSYVVLWKTVFFFISDGCEDISFSHFSCEKQISSHPSEAVPGFSDVRLRVLLIFSYVFFTLSIIIITYDTLSLYRRESSIVRSCPLIRRPWRIPPPVRNQAKTRWVLGGSRKKMVSADSLGQCASYRTIRTKKARWNSLKNSPFVPRLAQPMHIE